MPRIPEPSEGWLERFDAFSGEFMTRHKVPGAAVTIVHEGETAYGRAFGERDREAGAPAAMDTLFGLASVTKAFTALTLLNLEARGLLRLDDPVTRYLPSFTYPGFVPEAPVRVWHLASHTSGLPPVRGLDYAVYPSQVGDPSDAYNTRDYTNAPRVDDYPALLAYLASGTRPALAHPGGVVSYSNDGYGLLGAVIEAATGEAYPAVVRREVLGPLGLGAGFDTAEARATGRLTELYTSTPSGEVIHSPQWEEAPAYLATGFLKASADDLSAYLKYLLAPAPGRLAVSPEAVGQLWRPRAWAEHLTSYGLGWMLRERFNGLTLRRHGGSLKGISSHVGMVPELGLGIAVLTNLDEVPVKRLWFAAVNAYLGLPLGAAPFAHGAQPTTDEAELLAGVFDSGEPWGRLELVRDGESLRALSGETASDIGVVELLPNGEFVVADETGPWDSGRFVWDGAPVDPPSARGGGVTEERGVRVGKPGAVQFGMRWYDRTDE